MKKLSKNLLSNKFDNNFFSYYANDDCVKICKKYIPDNYIDLIINDPPYGIDGDKLHKHYNRNENYVIKGYVEVDKKKYGQFTLEWMLEAERVLKPGGSMYILSGWTNLFYILDALQMALNYNTIFQYATPE